MEFIETRVGKMLNEIKLAYLSGVHVIYIPTRDKELINELVFGEECIGAVIPRMSSNNGTILKDANQGRESQNIENYSWNRPFNANNHIWNKQGVPELFVYIGTNTHHKHNGHSSWLSPCILDSTQTTEKRSVKDCVLEILYDISLIDLLILIELLSLKCLLISPAIIGTAYVENCTFCVISKLSIAFIRPTTPT